MPRRWTIAEVAALTAEQVQALSPEDFVAALAVSARDGHASTGGLPGVPVQELPKDSARVQFQPPQS